MKLGRFYSWWRQKDVRAQQMQPILSQRLSYRLHNSRFEDAPRAGITLGSVFQLPSEPVFVRLIYANDRPEHWKIDGASVACIESFSPGQNPSDGWRTVTFSHSGADSGPLDGADTNKTSINVPANPREAGQVQMIFSDWLPVTAKPRNDGQPGYLVEVRTFSQGIIRCSGAVGPADPVLMQTTGGYWQDGNTISGDGGKCELSDRLFSAHGIQYISALPGLTILGIGDSIMHSSCTSGELSGFGVRAAQRLSSPLRPVSYVSEGYPGRNSLGYATCGAWGLTMLKPQVALIQTFSQNDPWTQDAADIAFGRAMALCDLARSAGCIPVLTTPAPVCEPHPQAELHRTRTVERVRALSHSGVAVLDLDAIWGKGSIPNGYRDDSGCGDTMHPSDAGCAHAADILTPMLAKMLNFNDL